MTTHAIDDELMKEHLKVHHAALAKLRTYQETVKDPEGSRIIMLQVSMMENHVSTMENLLNHGSGDLPPIPISPNRELKDQSHDGPLSAHDVAMDCRLTSEAMGADNYWSAQHMHDPSAQKIHFEMSQQNASVSSMWAEFLKNHKESMSRAMR